MVHECINALFFNAKRENTLPHDTFFIKVDFVTFVI